MLSESLFRSHLLTTGRSQETAKTYGHSIANLRHWADSQNLDAGALDRRQVESYLGRELTRVSRNSAAGRLAALRAWFDFLAKPEATAGLKIRREKLAPHRPAHPDDLATLVRAANNPRDAALIVVALETGIRVSELVGIRGADVDLRAGLLQVRGKGSKDRWVGLSQDAQNALRPFLRAGAIWRTQAGAPMTVGLAKIMLSRLAARAGVRAHWHLFRTTFASRFLADTHDLDSLRVLMGHTDTTTTQRYAEFNAQARALASQRERIAA